MLALILTLASATAQLADARISIAVEEDRAVVTASYRLTPPADSVVYSAIRISGQSIEVDQPALAADYQSLPGLTRLVSRTASGAEHTETIVYDVTGDVRRVALFVPDVAAAASGKIVAIEVRGVDPASPLTDAFPRLHWATDSVLIAELADMPSFVRIPGAAGGIGANRLADLAAIAVVAFGTLFWIFRRASRS